MKKQTLAVSKKLGAILKIFPLTNKKFLLQNKTKSNLLKKQKEQLISLTIKELKLLQGAQHW